MEPTTYGERVRAVRARLGLTQGALGEAIGCSAQNVCSVESGCWRFGREVEAAFARFAGVDREYIADAPMAAPAVESSDAA